MTTLMILAVVAIVGVVVYSSFSNTQDPAMVDDVMEKTTLQDKASDDAMMVGEEEAVDGDYDGAAEVMEDDAMMAEADMTIDMSSFVFTPNAIEIKAGETMTIKLTNSGGFHDLVIDELDVASEQINEGDETMITITAPLDAKGDSYEFYCSVGNHREQGMVGVIKVI